MNQAEQSQLKAQADDFVRLNAVRFLSKNARRYSWNSFYGQAQNGMFCQIDPQPFECKVLAEDESWILVRIGTKSEFKAIYKPLLSVVPDVGSKVLITPYARCGFDGIRLDAPEPKTNSGNGFTSQVFHIGGKALALPIEKAQNPYLNDLVGQIQMLPAVDGVRKLVNVLADVGAVNFQYEDDVYENDGENQSITPALFWEVTKSEIFTGRMGIVYDRCADTYQVVYGEQVAKDLCFDDLPAWFARLLDDGIWKNIGIQTVSKAPQRLAKAA